MYQSILFARGKTGKVKNDAMPPKVGRVASDGKRVFEPSHNDSPLGQNMDEPWADGPPAYIMDDSHVSRRFPTWYLKIGRGFTQFTTRRQERQSERRASNLFTTFLTSPPDLERFFQASKRQVSPFSENFHPSVQNWSTPFGEFTRSGEMSIAEQISKTVQDLLY